MGRSSSKKCTYPTHLMGKKVLFKLANFKYKSPFFNLQPSPPPRRHQINIAEIIPGENSYLLLACPSFVRGQQSTRFERELCGESGFVKKDVPRPTRKSDINDFVRL